MMRKDSATLLRRRLVNQRLVRTSFRKPEDVVAWFGAVQAQDYLGSLWAIGQRMRSATQVEVEAAEARRAIVRLWPMRGTLHFVAAADARWMTQLLAPRVLARNAARIKREVQVDAGVVARCREVIARSLEGGRRLERAELYRALEARRIRTGGSRGLHILGWLAQEGTVCLAGRSGKQHTFALLDEWLPRSVQLDREAALAELATRYFTSHGPATLKDFMWWAGLTAKDARSAAQSAQPSLAREAVEGTEYWWREPANAARGAAAGNSRAPLVRLLPAFDEYTVAYHDRRVLAGDSRTSKMTLLGPAVLVDGRVCGTWKRQLEPRAVRIAVKTQRRLSRTEAAALRLAARAYGDFVGHPARLEY